MRNYKFNQGFALLPIIFLLIISQIFILQGSKQLHHSLVMHKLKLYQDCKHASQQLNLASISPSCPKCPLADGCND